MALFGCSNGSNTSIVLDSTGKHPANWLVPLDGGNHPVTYLTSPEKCLECHGTDLKGGVSNVSCFSADRNGITCHAQGPSGHPTGWNNPSAHGAHAKAAATGANGIAFCKNCHGADYSKVLGTKSCTGCHGVAAPHPPKPWFGSASTHKNTDTSNAPACAACHTNRANLSIAGAATLPATAMLGTTGCFNNTLCHGAMGHSSDPQPWSSPANHGARAIAEPGAAGNYGLATCQQCHGTDFSGGNVKQSCFPCHGVPAPHPKRADWTLKAGVLSHVAAGEGNISVCVSCHTTGTKNLAEPYLTRFASSPAGSFVSTVTPGCFNTSTCHGDVRKTTNCDACHSTATSVPFKSMVGATAASDTKVGAHVKHLNASTQAPAYSSNIACSECHAVPGTPAISGAHRNGTNDIAFGTVAKTGSLIPTYAASTGVCANTYCHGTTLTGGGSNKSPVWNQTNYLVAGCATCHGYPPTSVRNGAATHSTSSSCSGCHAHVNATNNGFSDPSKHINGTIEASGAASHVFPNPGSSHKGSSNGTGCLGCHAFGSSTSGYPVTSGTPPDCRACHLNANPGTDPQCSDCHGSAANNNSATLAGRPVAGGATFPNRPGQHNRSEHVGRACTVCHPFTSGSPLHGWSNRTKSTAAQVGGAGTSINSWNPVTKSCSPVCHGSEKW